ncbi:MAG: prepilin-type N-terminal cleavage/methylation domain-containing protein [Neisseriaceae bacterium]|nr:prepilin-type N-terminal cleavage/methylation domain-containing protein [Neisseriaceae bacterium]
MYGKSQGFTLTELMITVAVLAILLSIAIPTYSNQQKKNRLEDARAALIENVYFMEQFYIKKHSFKQNSTT